jgi:hypothetical protein
MAISAPVLGTGPNKILPYPSEYRERKGRRGGAILTANGGVLFDTVGGGAKRVFVMQFRGLTSAKKAQIETIFDGIGHIAVPFTPPNDLGDSTQINVTWSNEQMELEWEATSVGGGTMLLWETSIMLREV